MYDHFPWSRLLFLRSCDLKSSHCECKPPAKPLRFALERIVGHERAKNMLELSEGNGAVAVEKIFFFKSCECLLTRNSFAPLLSHPKVDLRTRQSLRGIPREVARHVRPNKKSSNANSFQCAAELVGVGFREKFAYFHPPAKVYS